MVCVTSASRYVTSASRYQSRSSLYIRGLIPRNSTDLAEIVLIGHIVAQLGLSKAVKKGSFWFYRCKVDCFYHFRVAIHCICEETQCELNIVVFEYHRSESRANIWPEPRWLSAATCFKAMILLLLIYYLSRDMRFPTMWYVRPAKAQISLCIRAV